MLKSWQFWSVMTAIGILTGLLAFGFTRDPKIVKSPLIGLPAANFTVSELNTGEPLELAGLKGSAVLLNFWASWCAACRDEAPLLEAAHQKWGGDQGNFRVIGIAIQDTVEDARKFAKRFGKTYYLALDKPTGDIAINYGVYGVPESFFIDAEGIIRFKHIGALTKEMIWKQVPALIERSAKP